MQLAHRFLMKTTGLRFYKLMGSGAGNGFSIKPDFSTFCLLADWETETDRLAFFEENDFWKNYLQRGTPTKHLLLKPTKTRGTWDGENPFEQRLHAPEKGSPIAVVTRALFKPKYLYHFWKEVPQASLPVPNTPGHIFSKGVGELPLILQATVSVWENVESMYDYAYRNQKHIDMIKKTKQLGWYKEEMFTEFKMVEWSV